MSDAVSIREARCTDLRTVAAFLDDCWRTAYRHLIADDFLDAMSVDERYKGILTRYDEKASEFLMMHEGEQLIGTAVFGKSFTPGFEEDGEISAIYLHKDYIGKGYGHRLFLQVEDALALTGYENLVLDVLSENREALEFYLAHGYRKVDDQHLTLGTKTYPITILRKTCT